MNYFTFLQLANTQVTELVMNRIMFITLVITNHNLHEDKYLAKVFFQLYLDNNLSSNI
jgi:hypothetical protein